MPAVRQLPAKLDLECIAGDPFTVTITATGITTLTSPAVTMTTATGDAYITDPGIPTASVAGLAVTSAWSTADTAALNTGTRGKTYRYSIAANPDSAGLFEIVAGTLTVHPVGHAGTSSASSATLAVTVGTTAVSLAVALGGGGGGGGATTLDDLTDVTITTPTNGQVLKYNGSVWVNGTDVTGGGGGTLDDLTDVTITAAASGDILRHNGTAWVDAVGTTHFEAAGGIATHAAVTSSVHGISAFGATLVDDADAATARTTLGLVIGTNVQAYDADLADIAGVTRTKGDLIVATSSAWTDLAVGTNGHVLTADSAEATGVKWAAASGGGGVTLPSGSQAGTSAYRGLPGWFPAGAGSNLNALSQYDVYTFPIFVTQAITITGYDINLQSGNSAGTLFRAGIYASSGTTDSWAVGSLTSDLNTCALDTTGAKSRTGLSVSLAAGWHVLAFGCDAAAAVFYGFEMSNAYSGHFDISQGTNAAQYVMRWWYDYNVGNSPPTSGMPATLATNSQQGLNISGNLTRFPISLRWTNP